jgi:putative Holliday junction resolvase
MVALVTSVANADLDGFGGKVKILAVDHGSLRIGLAISDETGTIANPLQVIKHTSRLMDAAQVAEVARSKGAGLIVVGQSMDDNGNPTFEGRRAGRFADSIRTQVDIPVVMWDEAFTTQEARSARISMGVPRSKRSGHLDELAATVLLQSYLEGNKR